MSSAMPLSPAPRPRSGPAGYTARPSGSTPPIAPEPDPLPRASLSRGAGQGADPRQRPMIQAVPPTGSRAIYIFIVSLLTILFIVTL
jgi:hypothetical protein